MRLGANAIACVLSLSSEELNELCSHEAAVELTPDRIAEVHAKFTQYISEQVASR
mgnify:CR=1 FL=1